MKMPRIHITGAAGSGTSTLGKLLANKLHVEHFETDDYFHVPTDPPFQIQRSPEDRLQLITKDLLAHNKWVLSGSVMDWGNSPAFNFDAIVFLYVPLEVRIERLRQREKSRFGDRILEGGDMYEEHQEFIDWASRYEKGDVEGRTLQKHKDYLESVKSRGLSIEGDFSTDQQLERILSFIN